MKDSEYGHLAIDLARFGVVTITIKPARSLNAANVRLHYELGEIWRTFERDAKSRAAVITGLIWGFDSVVYHCPRSRGICSISPNRNSEILRSLTR